MLLNEIELLVCVCFVGWNLGICGIMYTLQEFTANVTAEHIEADFVTVGFYIQKY